MSAIRTDGIHYMDGFHLQNVGSGLRACPRTGLSISRHDCGVQIGLLHGGSTHYELLQTVAIVRLGIGRDWCFFESPAGRDDPKCTAGRTGRDGACSGSKRHDLGDIGQVPPRRSQIRDWKRSRNFGDVFRAVISNADWFVVWRPYPSWWFWRRDPDGKYSARPAGQRKFSRFVFLADGAGRFEDTE